jgi:hypothetical protein
MPSSGKATGWAGPGSTVGSGGTGSGGGAVGADGSAGAEGATGIAGSGAAGGAGGSDWRAPAMRAEKSSARTIARGKGRMARMGFGAWYTKAPWLVAGSFDHGRRMFGGGRFGELSVRLTPPRDWRLWFRGVRGLPRGRWSSATCSPRRAICTSIAWVRTSSSWETAGGRGTRWPPDRRPHVVREPARIATPRPLATPAAAPSRCVAFAPKLGEMATNQALFIPHPSPQLRKFPPRAPRDGFVAPLSTSFG